MKALFIEDKDFKTKLFNKLHKDLSNMFYEKGYEIETIEIGKGNLASCLGCFGCWIKKPGQCVIDDMMNDINMRHMNSDVVIYMTPIVFGQFSSNIKNAIDRYIPNQLPFFEKVNGFVKHPPRYEGYPELMIIGYSDDLTKEERETFVDITEKHRREIKNIFVCEKEEDNDEIIKSISKVM